jgi:hypothetical protein
VAEDPDSLAGVFGCLEFFDHEFKGAAYVWVGCVDEVEIVCLCVSANQI